MLHNLALMMSQRRIRNGTNRARLLLRQSRVCRRQMRIHRPDDRARAVGDRGAVVGALESGTLGGVHGGLVVGRDLRRGGMVVDHIVVVFDLCRIDESAFCVCGLRSCWSNVSYWRW